MKKINVLVVPSDNQGGVGFYRSTQPHIQLEKQFPEEFSVTINMNPDFNDLTSFDKYDIIHIHKGTFGDMALFDKALQYFKEKGIVTVLDIDDHWKFHEYHPAFEGQRYTKSAEIIQSNIEKFDYITTTTPIFADEIRKFRKCEIKKGQWVYTNENANVKVLPNAIDPEDERFAVNKKESKFVRVGMIMGSTHEHDMMLLNNVANRLPQDVFDKVQFVLCGFDIRGTRRIYNKETGDCVMEKIPPKEGIWYRYEQMLTNNFKIVSPEYRNFLEMFIPDSHYPNEDNEHYKRCWTKPINSYYQHYSECDILLAPLAVTDFNKVKSQLKVIESAFSHTAIIASDFGPYTLDLKHAIEKGGIWNPEGNALLVDEQKNHKLWAKYIEKLVREPEKLKQLQDNLYNDIHIKYDLKTVTKDRADFYRNIVKNE